jgi:4-amino-4-deoxy-L-arabinose transferase-like glycosyltransferase
LALLLTAALGLAFRWWRDGRRGDATLALVLVGAATLAKGPVAPVLFALAVGGFLAWQPDLRRLPGLLTAPGVAGFVLLALGWYALALGGWGDAFVSQHLVGRYAFNLLGDLPAGGRYSTRPLGYHLAFYLQHLPAVALPWTPFVALGLWWAWRRDRLHDPAVRFLVCWTLAPILAFTPAQWKLRHYLLPALPALALLAAPAVIALVRERPRALSRWAAGAAAAAALAAGVTFAAVAAGYVPLSKSDQSTLDGVLAIVPGAALGAAALVGAIVAAAGSAAARRAWWPVVGVLGAAVVGWMALGAPRFEARVSQRDSLRPFAEQVRALDPPPGTLVFFGREPMRSVVVYVGRQVPTIHRAEDLRPGSLVIALAAEHARLQAAGYLGTPRLVAEGRPGNLGRAQVVLAEVTGTPLERK